MGSRTVRLDDEAEDALREIRSATGMTISQALEKGLLVLRETLAKERRAAAWEIYEKIDLGAGGYSIAPAATAKKAVRDWVRRKHCR